MHPTVTAVVRGEPVEQDSWESFWEHLRSGRVGHGELAALLAAMTAGEPGAPTLHALVASLDRGPTAAGHRYRGAVNLVGSGGGTATFNISTAAAFVAAAMGVRIVKSGSGGFSSRYGSLDLLSRLGVPTTRSHEETQAAVCRNGIAFTGSFVYPPEIATLLHGVRPLDVRVLGRCVNVLGPFLAELQVDVQITGVSSPRLLPLYRLLASSGPSGQYWLCSNDAGIDELSSTAVNRILVTGGRPGGEPGHDEPGHDEVVDPHLLGFGPGTVEQLRPRSDGRELVRHFLDVLDGVGPPAAVDTVCLNAAATAVAAGVTADWADAVRGARRTMRAGEARRLAIGLRRPHRKAGSDGSGGPDRPGGSGSPGGFFTARPGGGEPGLALFLVAGDPPLDELADIVQALDEEGVDCLELAVPFPDSLTDGPVIRRSAQRALDRSVGLAETLRFVEDLRPRLRHLRIALLLDWRHTVRPAGLTATTRAVAAVGADGVLLHGLPPRLAPAYHDAATAAALPVVATCYATSTPDVRTAAARAAGAYVYLVPRPGRSGTTPSEGFGRLGDVVSDLRRQARAPIAVGFGVRGRDDVRTLAALGADAVVVGTAAVERVERAHAAGGDPVATLAGLARDLRPRPGVHHRSGTRVS